MSKLESYEICEGIIMNELTFSKCKDPSPSCSPGSAIRHTVALKLEHYEEDGLSFQACIFLRSPECEMLCSDTSCSNCTKQEKSINKQKKKLDVQQPQPLKNKVPLSKARKKRLAATVQRQRVVCKELEDCISS